MNSIKHYLPFVLSFLGWLASQHMGTPSIVADALYTLLGGTAWHAVLNMFDALKAPGAQVVSAGAPSKPGSGGSGK